MLLRAQVQLFADTFTEQMSYMGMLRADSTEAFETAKQKFITGLTVSRLAFGSMRTLCAMCKIHAGYQ